MALIDGFFEEPISRQITVTEVEFDLIKNRITSITLEKKEKKE